MRTGRISIFSAFVLTAVTLAAGCSSGSSSGSSSSQWPPPSYYAKSSVDLPVTACPTTRGVPERPKPSVGKFLAVKVTTSLAPKLTFYTDRARSLMPVLGPRDWDCKVQIGADGSADMTIQPPNIPNPSQTAVTVQWVPACQGCMYEMVCALIPDSSQQVGASFGHCPTKRPETETVDVSGGGKARNGRASYIAEFTDPPGVHGSGVPSGGPNPATGVLNYDWSPHRSAAARETCALTGIDELTTNNLLCRTILLSFANRHWGMPPGLSGVSIG